MVLPSVSIYITLLPRKKIKKDQPYHVNPSTPLCVSPRLSACKHIHKAEDEYLIAPQQKSFPKENSSDKQVGSKTYDTRSMSRGSKITSNSPTKNTLFEVFQCYILAMRLSQFKIQLPDIRLDPLQIVTTSIKEPSDLNANLGVQMH